jgi:NDP-sugar pyrophosphorylase family protein
VIEFQGRALIDFTLRELTNAGIRRLVVLTRSELRRRVSSAALSYDFESVVVSSSDRRDATTLVPYLMRRHLGTGPFFFVVAHAPPAAEHLREMMQVYEQNGGPVVSLYEGPRLSPKKSIVSVDQLGSMVRRADAGANPMDKWFVESPLIVTSAVLDAIGRELDSALNDLAVECLGLVTDEQFEQIGQAVRWIDDLILDDSATRGVVAPMPPEFDYEADHQDFMQYMRNRYP